MLGLNGTYYLLSVGGYSTRGKFTESVVFPVSPSKRWYTLPFDRWASQIVAQNILAEQKNGLLTLKRT